MYIWQVSSDFSVAHVPAQTAMEAIEYYLEMEDGYDAAVPIEIHSVERIGELLLPVNGSIKIGDTTICVVNDKLNAPPSIPSKQLASVREALEDAYRARGKGVGFARDLIPFLSKEICLKYWPNMSKDGLAKSISIKLEQMGLEYKKCSPRLFVFPVNK